MYLQGENKPWRKGVFIVPRAHIWDYFCTSSPLRGLVPRRQKVAQGFLSRKGQLGAGRTKSTPRGGLGADQPREMCDPEPRTQAQAGVYPVVEATTHSTPQRFVPGSEVPTEEETPGILRRTTQPA